LVVFGLMSSIQNYLDKIKAEFATGRAREHSYRPALKDLLEAVNSKILATNEPAREKCGAPDFVITDKNNIPRGYIEAKDITIGILDKPENQKQIKKYFDGELGYNFLHTDNLEFRFYRDGERVETVVIGKLENNTLIENPENFEKLEQLLKNFLTFHGQTISSSKRLSKLMAGKARIIRDMILGALEDSENCTSELRGQYETLRKVLMHNMKVSEFADVYAQTITYGLFAARLHDPTLPTFDRDEAARLLPKSNPFLQKFFQTLRDDIDPRIEWIVDDLIEVFKACNVCKILDNYGKSTRKNDPVVHFYEDFLADYDPKLRKARGVWYTPEPIVDFIVRGVDEILKTEFELEEGLADKSKIKIKVKTQTHDQRTKEKVKMMEKEVHRVQVLDPATGTGTFLAQVIKQVHSHYENMPALWSEYVKKDLIPRVHGFEILMASYAMAHMKLDLLLKELGHKSTSNERLGVYLTNSLEEAHPDTNTLFSSWLSEEASEANNIKQDTPVMCIIGNPPYSGESSNKGDWILERMESYKKEPGGKQKLQERNSKWINDDYVKFIRLGEDFIARNSEGVLAFITNHGYLDNPTFRGMRWHLLNTFDKIYVIDLHGSSKKKEISPDGSKDENVFDITTGVSLIFGIKKKERTSKLAQVYHSELWGKRGSKYEQLSENDINSIKWKKLENKAPYYFFVPKNYKTQKKYNDGFKLNTIFKTNCMGFQTHRDALVIDFTEAELLKKITYFKSSENTKEQIVNFLKIKEVGAWNIEKAKNSINSMNDWKKPIKLCDYRAFDKRYIYFDDTVVDRRRTQIVDHIENKNNLCLLSSKQQSILGFRHVFCSKLPANDCVLSTKSREGNQIFPLYKYKSKNSKNELFKEDEIEKIINLDSDIVLKIANNLHLRPSWITKIAQAVKKGEDPHLVENLEIFTPEDLFDYIYAVLHSPKYRETYKEFLKIDFPRIPYPTDTDNFWKLVELGRKIRELHLLESPLLSASKNIRFDGGSDLTVEKPKYNTETQRVYINDSVYFEGVDGIAWNFHIGGYQPAQKWLKDRKGRQLSVDDVKHYAQMIVAMHETNRLMGEIDNVIEI